MEKESGIPGRSGGEGPLAWRERLQALRASGLERGLRTQETAALPEVVRGGRRLLNLASNNYLGLAADPRIVEAGREALSRWGAGAGASRLVTGNLGLHDELETAIAAFKGTEAALVFTSGYAANVGAITTLAGPKDHIFADALNHASLIDGCRQSRAKVHRYRHGDTGHLEELLKASRGRGETLIVTDTVFSMDGDLAPLPELVRLAEAAGATLLVDDAHGTGVLGPGGRGAVHHFGLEGRVPVQIGTLSKALGVQGGFVAGSRVLVELLLSLGRSFVYSTGIAPALAGAALKAIEVAQGEEFRRKAQREHTRRLRTALAARGFMVTGEEAAPLTSVVLGEAEAALAFAAHLEEAGVLAPAIRPPTVPKGQSRVRLAPMATHSEEQISRAIEAFPKGPA